jgi:hypothetical protein
MFKEIIAVYAENHTESISTKLRVAIFYVDVMRLWNNTDWGNRITLRRTCHSGTSSITNPTWTKQGENLVFTVTSGD